MFLDRSRRSDHHLEWKVRAFTVAAVLGIAGIFFEEPWMTGGAIAVLLAGLFLRVRPSSGEGQDEEGGDEDA